MFLVTSCFFALLAVSLACPPPGFSPTSCATAVCPTGQSCIIANSCAISGQFCNVPTTFPICSLTTKGASTVQKTFRYCVSSGTCSDLGGAAATPAQSYSNFNLCCGALGGSPASEAYTLTAGRTVVMCYLPSDTAQFKVCLGSNIDYCVRFPNSCEASDSQETTGGNVINNQFQASTYAGCCESILLTGNSVQWVATTAATSAYGFNGTVDKCTKA